MYAAVQDRLTWKAVSAGGLAQCLTFQAPPDGREVKEGQGPSSPRAQDTGSVHWIGAISVTEEKSN